MSRRSRCAHAPVPMAAHELQGQASWLQSEAEEHITASRVLRCAVPGQADELHAMAASGRALFETMQEWLFARCRSRNDLLELQMRCTRSSADRFLTEATKLAELSVRVASASPKPRQARAGFAERLPT
jgi:hypothetical protein